MKGTILVCLKDMLVNEYNITVDEWKEMQEAAGLGRNTVLLPSTDIQDGLALSLFGQAEAKFFKSHEEMADAYGRYWSVIYAPNLYSSVYRRANGAKDFLLKMDDVHIQVTQNIVNSRPPRFKYEQEADGSLLIHYNSARGLIHLFAGLCRGVGIYYKEAMKVDVLSNDKLAIRFL